MQLLSLSWEDPLEEEMAPIPVLLLGKSHKQEHGGLWSMWSQRVKMTKHVGTHAQEPLDPSQSSDQSLSRVRLCDSMNCNTPGIPVHHQLPESTQTHVRRVDDAI